MGGILSSKPQAPQKSEEEKKLEEAQSKRLEEQEKQIEARDAAKRRKKRGRASLISNSEQGIPDKSRLG